MVLSHIWEVATSAWESCSEIWDDEDQPSEAEHVLPRGLVIRESRLIYDHYGIYAGKRKVIHFTDGKVRLTGMNKFAPPSSRLDILRFDEAVVIDITLEESYRRARSLIGTTGYSLINKNCEHFAVWCRTGRSFSSQAFGREGDDFANSNLMSCSLIGWLGEMFNNELGMETSREITASQIR